MSDAISLTFPAAGPVSERPITIAIVAMGGQGGGVLTEWIVRLGLRNGWTAQSTSVPGVAQRTGATIYYIEMMPVHDGRKPVLAQMPTPGDVDIVIAAEFMEAGRAILRGLVTPDRTTLIASSHRSLAIAEKTVPGDGIADSSAVHSAINVAAKRSIVFDMNEIAVRNGSVISSALFGALAGSGILPLAKSDYIDTIRVGSRAVEASIRAFEEAFSCVTHEKVPDDRMTSAREPAAPAPVEPDPRFARLLSRLVARLPQEAHTMAKAGLAKVVDYQDARYGEEYLSVLERLCAADREAGGADRAFLFTTTAAKYVANAMTYDDITRVADLKTRRQRFIRIREEMGLREDQVMQITEFMHPRMEEVNGLLPLGLGRWIEARPRLFAWFDRRINKGRRIDSSSLTWFAILYVIGGMRFLRRGSLRDHGEREHRNVWLENAVRLLQRDYRLGVKVLQCQRLIKGYSDTHARGQSNFSKVMETILLLEGREDAVDWAQRMIDAATRDSSGEQLDGTIATIRSFL